MNIIELARKFRKFIEEMSVNATDEEALNNIEAFPKWEVGKLYDIIGERIRYNGKLYKVLTEHRSQADWTPDIAVSLYIEVSIEEWAEWKQPTGAHDAYSFGDKVSHLLKEDGSKRHWISIFEGLNVWEPGSVGTESLWQEVE